jgi:hypothetical protein
MSVTLIQASISGEVFAVDGGFHLKPTVTLRNVYMLSDLLPSAEEGNRSFKLEEYVVADVNLQLNVGDSSILLHSSKNNRLSETSVFKTLDHSAAYTEQTEKNQKNFRFRTRALMSEIAKKEALESNAPILESEDTIAGVEKRIEELKAKINNLLRIASKKTLVENQKIDEALYTLAEKTPDSLADADFTDLATKLRSLVEVGYSFL